MTPLFEATRELFFRAAASGIVPARFFLPYIPPPSERSPRTGELRIEIVSHCWNYQHLLAYQLSSLVLHPPSKVSVRMTVFFSPEDEGTGNLLRFFGAIEVPRVVWNWEPLERALLMRRAIGRNRAALASTADWLWFTDCDVVFHEGALDGLGTALQGRRDALVHPREEWVTSLLAGNDPMLQAGAGEPRIVEIDPSLFTPRRLQEATGPLQITHGDVARVCGYCDTLPVYQKPAARWRKAHEDRAFRWLLRTKGMPIDVPGVFRIRHQSKGRYADTGLVTALRLSLRRLQSWWRDPMRP